MNWQALLAGSNASAVVAFLACVLFVGLATIGVMTLLQLLEPLEQASNGEIDALDHAARPAAWIRSLLRPDY
jgi:dolichol kinase